MPISLRLPLLIVTLVASAGGCAMHGGAREFLYVGTSNSRGSEGLYVYEFSRSDATLTLVQTVTDRRGPAFQALHPNGEILYSVSSHRFAEGSDFGTLSAYRIDRTTGTLSLLDEAPARGSAYLSVDPGGRYVYLADYGGGRLSVHGIGSDGTLTEALDSVQHTGASVNPERQTEPHVHSVVPGRDGRFLYASDLGLDRIFVYAVDEGSGRLTPGVVPYVETTPGSGPRHLIVHPNGNVAYSVEEMHHAVAAYAIEPATGALTEIDRQNLVPAGFDPTIYVSGADLHLSPDNEFLYVSNRGHDHLVIYRVDPSAGTLTLAGGEPTGVRPVNFAIDEAGEFVFVANNTDDDVGIFRRSAATGLLAAAGELLVPAPTCLTHLVLD